MTTLKFVIPTVATADDSRGGLIVLTPEGDDCTVFVKFRPVGSTPEEREFIQRKDGQISFGYTVPALSSQSQMVQLAAGVKHLNESSGRAFQKVDLAFEDVHAIGEALRPLAQQGWNLYRILFGVGEEPSDFYPPAANKEEVRLYGDLLRRWLETAIDIQIVCPPALLPWNILYSADPASGSTVAPETFWAFSKNLQLYWTDLCDETLIPREWGLRAGVESSDASLAQGTRVHEASDHPFQIHADRISQVDCAKQLFRDLSNPSIIYHYGHAETSMRGYGFARISVNNNSLDAMTLRADLLAKAVRVDGPRPMLVYLNGCWTAADNTNAESIWGVLVQHQIRHFCFVTTLGAVPAWPAAMFARYFFSSFLGDVQGSRQLGEAMMAARKAMLRVFRNPIGLLYCAWGKLSTRIGRASGQLAMPGIEAIAD
jgi:hypothetical protein